LRRDPDVQLELSNHGKEAKMSKNDNRRRREFLKSSAGAVFAASGWGWQIGAARAEDEATVHGMAIAGEQTVILYHLPLFHGLHTYQVILEATFTKPGSDPQSAYFNDRKRSGAPLYTLEPEPFVLPRLVAAQPLRTFKGNVYRGHFEMIADEDLDAARIGKDVDVKVTRVIHFHKFDLTAAKPDQLEYLLFGKGAELFVAHLATRPPDFDQVLSVKVPNHTFTDDELREGMPIVLPGRSNSPNKRIDGREPLTAQIKGKGGAAPKTVQLQPGIEFYFDQKDLRR
jgi:hypothetical protein